MDMDMGACSPTFSLNLRNYFSALLQATIGLQQLSIIMIYSPMESSKIVG